MSELEQVASPEIADAVGPTIEFSKLTDSITVYTGVVPLTFTIEAFLEQLEAQGVSTWYITLHLTGFGTDQVVFVSNTVQATLNTIVSVPFPSTMQQPVASNAYNLTKFVNTSASSTSTEDETDEAPKPGPTPTFYVNVQVSAPPVGGGTPTVSVVNTSVAASWFIGARDIVITDPPIKFSRKKE